MHRYLDQDLKKYLDVCERGLETTILKSFLYQLLNGVAYCHLHRVLHRDLKVVVVRLWLDRTSVVA